MISKILAAKVGSHVPVHSFLPNTIIKRVRVPQIDLKKKNLRNLVFFLELKQKYHPDVKLKLYKFYNQNEDKWNPVGR